MFWALFPCCATLGKTSRIPNLKLEHYPAMAKATFFPKERPIELLILGLHIGTALNKKDDDDDDDDDDDIDDNHDELVRCIDDSMMVAVKIAMVMM